MRVGVPGNRAATGALVTAVALVVFVPAYWFDSGEYGAYAAGVQAAGVLLALIYASSTLTTQKHVAAEALRSQAELERVSRALAFHEAMVSGEIQAARIRLIDHLRAAGEGNRPLRVTLQTLRGREYPPRPGDQPGAVDVDRPTPIHDVHIVLRFFERAEPALTRGLVDRALFHQLLGRHIAWWDEAIDRNEGEAVRYALSTLADWVWTHTQEDPAEKSYVGNWIRNLTQDFPSGRYAGIAAVSRPERRVAASESAPVR